MDEILLQLIIIVIIIIIPVGNGEIVSFEFTVGLTVLEFVAENSLRTG